MGRTFSFFFFLIFFCIYHVLFLLYSTVSQLFIYTYPLSFRFFFHMVILGFSVGSDGKESACNAGDPGSNPGLGRPLGKGISTHSSILAWRIPWTEE